MSKVWVVNGVAFRDRPLTWRYVSTYKSYKNAEQYPQIQMDEKDVKKVYDSLEEFEKDYPQAIIDRLRSERTKMRQRGVEYGIELPFSLVYSNQKDMKECFDADFLTNGEGYEFVKIADKTIEEQKIDLNNDEQSFEVIVSNKVNTLYYNLTVGEYKTLKNLIETKLNKIATLTDEIEKAMKTYDKLIAKDKDLLEENKESRLFQKDFMKRLQEDFEDSHFDEEERDL